MTSEKMNHNILMRNDMPTWSLYNPPSLSLMTVPNQPINMNAVTQAPKIINHGPAVPSLRNSMKPSNKVKSPMDPMIGHALGFGR